MFTAEITEKAKKAFTQKKKPNRAKINWFI
jgi:hypothetical protein